MFATTKLPCLASPVCTYCTRTSGPCELRVADRLRCRWSGEACCFVAPFIVRWPCHAMPSRSASVLLSRATVTSRHIQRRGMQQCGINQAVPPLAVCSSCASYDTHFI